MRRAPPGNPSWIGLHAQGPAFSTSGLHVRGNPARGYWDVEGMHRAGSTNLSYDARPGASSIHAWWSDDEKAGGHFPLRL